MNISDNVIKRTCEKMSLSTDFEDRRKMIGELKTLEATIRGYRQELESEEIRETIIAYKKNNPNSL